MGCKNPKTVSKLEGVGWLAYQSVTVMHTD